MMKWNILAPNSKKNLKKKKENRKNIVTETVLELKKFNFMPFLYFPGVIILYSIVKLAISVQKAALIVLLEN